MDDRLRHPLDDAVRYGPVSGKIHDARDSTHGKQPLVQSVTAKQPFISASSAFHKKDRDPE
jgi:hypothetical protein